MRAAWPPSASPRWGSSPRRRGSGRRRPPSPGRWTCRSASCWPGSPSATRTSSRGGSPMRPSCSTQALELVEARGLPTWFPWAAALKGHALALSGRPEDGLALLERALERAEALPFLFGHSQWLAWRAQALALIGRRTRRAAAPRRRCGSAASAASEVTRRGRSTSWARSRLGAAGRRTAAEAWFQQGLALATELGMRPLVARCHQGLGRLRPAADGAAARTSRGRPRAARRARHAGRARPSPRRWRAAPAGAWDGRRPPGAPAV